MKIILESPYHLIRLLVPEMNNRGYGQIINISSDWDAFSQGLNGSGSYGIAKSSTKRTHTGSFAKTSQQHIKSAMCPGWVRTRIGRDQATRNPIEAANTAIWLAQLSKDGSTGGFFRDRQPLAW